MRNIRRYTRKQRLEQSNERKVLIEKKKSKTEINSIDVSKCLRCLEGEFDTFFYAITAIKDALFLFFSLICFDFNWYVVI